MAARDHQAIEVSGIELVHRGIDGERIAPLSLIGLLTGPGHDRTRTFLLQANLRVPELEVFVEGSGEKEDGLSVEAHGRTRESNVVPSRKLDEVYAAMAGNTAAVIREPDDRRQNCALN